ncbi:Uncharacterised protein [Mycobacteroides abscessus subsp. abscessus]|uniref:DUF7233 domain-containing protein n=1 Tax=Mycobacteroides abscessus TaxID=36809 RepID=UPI00092A3F4E|nr:hypothetical protein [Mycobacteroides abscessus]MDO3135583.1 hypothetical protein [Mycobacteroides abscessus subsp. abscessus]MDO3151125.1 hypothetical protein [Mycobacteroides abscessus subsp. abscessus]SHT89694.1 Uncharacterised protein [Mycobacteroides abscessus subsp. abscessus]SIE45977.1 Uncharacterised protein [Mycobacteroides abscessus subsp. abscessus]SKU54666.1 Uncharacterised protein [Mycobacteroides abscessus subsp. bolletii]
MTFTPNMIGAKTTIDLTPTQQWQGTIVPRGASALSIEDLGGGQITAHVYIRYDYGPFQAAGDSDPEFAFLADRLLVKVIPHGAALDYTDQGSPMGEITIDAELFDVYIYIERDVMCISHPAEQAGQGRKYSLVPTAYPW